MDQNNTYEELESKFMDKTHHIIRMAIDICNKLTHLHDKERFHGNLNSKTIQIDDFGNTVIKNKDEFILSPYTSPEQTGIINKTVDYRTDLYSLGIFLYHQFTGKFPFIFSDENELIHAIIAKIPSPPRELNQDIPLVISIIILKLLSKNAEDRYKSALGLKYDLERFLKESASERTANVFFPIGEKDFSSKFEIPQKLYGREAETEILLNAVERISNQNAELLLITGFSGIGKTSLVDEVRKKMIEKNGYFISGKYDQFNRNIPYSALIQAFNGLIRQILAENPKKIAVWKSRIQTALSVNGQVIVDVIPDLELIVGKQPEIEELLPNEAQNRFHYVLENFIEAFAQKEHPLVVFLDDLQWVDLATLNLFDLIITNPENKHLLLIGAYRDNEVDDCHPLISSLRKIESQQGKINSIVLQPLLENDLSEIIKDTLNCNTENAATLAKLFLKKTEGNPFYFKQFLQSLYDKKIITFNTKINSWDWDISKIESMNLTDNLAQFMAKKIKGLSTDVQDLLKVAAAIGNQFNSTLLSHLLLKNENETLQLLSLAHSENLIVKLNDDENQYKFSHDQIQTAFYSLIPEKEIKTIHLKIGKLLYQLYYDKQKDDYLFDIVNHLNDAGELISKNAEKLQLVELNLQAGIKARNTLAYISSYEFLSKAQNLFEINDWGKKDSLCFKLNIVLSEVAYLCGKFEESERLINNILVYTTNEFDKSNALNLLIIQHTMSGKMTNAIDAGKSALHYLGITLEQSDMNNELEQINDYLKNNPPSVLFQSKEMTDEKKKIAIKILANLGPPFFLVNMQLYNLSVIKMVSMSIEYGIAEESSGAFGAYALILSSMKEYKQASEFAQLAIDLSDRYKNLVQKCKITDYVAGHINHWTNKLISNLDFIEIGFQAGINSGEFQWAGYNLMFEAVTLFYSGQNLENIKRKLNDRIVFAERTKNHLSTDVIKGSIIAITLLQHPDYYNWAKYSIQPTINLPLKNSITIMNFDAELKHIDNCDRNKSSMELAFYFIRKTQLLYLLCEINDAKECVLAIEDLLTFIPATFPIAVYCFYHSLIYLHNYSQIADEEKRHILSVAKSDQNQMKNWAENAPENFLHMFQLVEAEIARVEGKHDEAIDLYDKAIESAKENGFLQNQALANELAAKFWLTRHKEKIAKLYMTEAYQCYQHWGAEAKLKQLEKNYPQLLTSTIDKFKTINFDKNTIIKASQALSGEIKLPELLKKLMTYLIENAGAERGFLILEKNGNLYIEAEVNAKNEDIQILQSVEIDKTNKLSQKIVNFVQRTNQTIILDNANNEGDFTLDKYIIENKVKSVLCQPLLSQGKLIGIIYLENNLLIQAFSKERLNILQIIVSQAVISIENALLVSNLEEKVAERTYELQKRESLLNDMGRTAKVGGWEIDLLSQKQIWTDEVFRIHEVDFDYEPDVSKGISFYSIESRPVIQKAIERAFEYGEPFNLELEFITAKGNSRWVRAIGKAYQENGKISKIGGTFQDITARKQSEIRQKELEAANLRLQKAESLSQMAGGIAHLFNNYLYAVSGNLELALEELPDDSSIRYSLTEAMKAANRCADVSGSMLTYLGQSFVKMESIDISKFCQEHLPTLQSSFNNNITINIKLSDSELIIRANHGQMQQVLNHLITNACESIGENKGRINLTTKTIPASNVSKFHIFPVDSKLSAVSYACLEITDTGCGISKEDFHKLFDPFFTTKFTGRGLGLAIVSGIVKSWGGMIGVRSKVGHGSTFMVFLPLSEDNSIKQSQNLAQSLQPQQKELSTVLLVEDHEMVRNMATAMLKRMGFEVISAVNGVEAVKLFRQHKESVSCLITDLSMPELDGWGTLAEIRKIKPNIPAILASGYDEAFAMSRDDSEKPQAFLHKPYTMADLKRVLGQAINS